MPTTSEPTTSAPTTPQPTTEAPTTSNPTTPQPTPKPTGKPTNQPTLQPTEPDEVVVEIEIIFKEPPSFVNNKTNISIIVDIIANKTGVDAKDIFLTVAENEAGGTTLLVSVIAKSDDIKDLDETDIEDTIQSTVHCLFVSNMYQYHPL